jgi:hypothetical protein
MTNTILAIIIIVYLLIAFGFCFVNTILCGCPNDTKELVVNLLWIIYLPCAIIMRFYKKYIKWKRGN